MLNLSLKLNFTGHRNGSEIQVLENKLDNKRTRNCRQVLGPLTTPLGDINRMYHWQESLEDEDKVIDGVQHKMPPLLSFSGT